MINLPIRILVVGSTVLDKVHVHKNHPFQLGIKTEADDGDLILGGGGGNIASAMREIAYSVGLPLEITLATKIGITPSYLSRRDQIIADFRRDLVVEELRGNPVAKVRLLDLLEDRPHIIPESMVLSSNEERSISTIFKSNGEIIDGVVSERLWNAAEEADIVFLNVRYLYECHTALLAAVNSGKEVFTDFNMSSIPKENTILQIYKNFLDHSYGLVMPGETLIPEVTPERGRFQTLKTVYEVPNFAISNGADDVETCTEEHGDQILSTEQAEAYESLGCGDGGNAMAVLARAVGINYLDAFKMRGATATFSTQYFGKKWLSHHREHMLKNPVYKPFLDKVAEIKRGAGPTLPSFSQG